MEGGHFTPRLEENKRKIMQSSIFGGNDEKPQYKSPQRQIQQQSPPQRQMPMQDQHYYQGTEVQQYRSPQINSENIPQTNYAFTGSKNSSISTPSFTGLVHCSNIPALSAFPDINLAPIQSNDSYDFSLKPRTALRPPQRSLTFKPNNQMKMMRESLSQDMTSFQQRIQRLNVNTPLNIKMATFEHKQPKTAIQAQRQNVGSNDIMQSPPKQPSGKQSRSKQQKSSFNDSMNKSQPFNPNDSMNMSGTLPTNASTLSTSGKMNLNDSMNMSGSINMNGSINSSLNSSMNAPGFTTHSEFIMPDGSTFD